MSAMPGPFYKYIKYGNTYLNLVGIISGMTLQQLLSCLMHPVSMNDVWQSVGSQWNPFSSQADVRGSIWNRLILDRVQSIHFFIEQERVHGIMWWLNCWAAVGHVSTKSNIWCAVASADWLYRSLVPITENTISGWKSEQLLNVP